MDGNLAMNSHVENMTEAEDAAAYEAHFIKKGNKLIAEFMNGKVTEFETCSPYPNRIPFGTGYDFDTLKISGYEYPTIWGWLMPVVEKIIDIRYDGDETAYLRTFGMRNHDGNYMVRFNWCSLHEADTLLWATYLAVVDFIEMQTAKKIEKKVCVNKIDGSCPLHNIHCQWPKCEEQ